MARPKAGPSVPQQLLPLLIELHHTHRRKDVTRDELLHRLEAFTTEALRICSAADPRVIGDMLRGVSGG